MGCCGSSEFPNHFTEAEELLDGNDCKGKVFFITGGNSGLGLETARVLAKGGAVVVIAARSEEKGKGAKDYVVKDTGCDADNVKTVVLDLASLASVESAVEQFNGLGLKRLDCLINNAGIMTIPNYQTTKDGFERQFGTNHVGHQHLTTLLLPVLKASAPSRVVSVSSGAHMWASKPYSADVMQCTEQNYTPMDAYANSKMCNINMGLALAEQNEKDGVTSYSVHPGVISGTNLGNNEEGRICFLKCIYCIYDCMSCCNPETKNIQTGAATQTLCALYPTDKLTNGGYYIDCKYVAEVGGQKRPECVDKELAQAVWGKTEEMIAKAKNA